MTNLMFNILQIGRILSNGTLSKSKEDLLQVNGGKPSSHQSNLAGKSNYFFLFPHKIIFHCNETP